MCDRYKELTEIPRKDMHEIEKNYFIFYDVDNTPYVHHELFPRSLAAVEGQFAGQNLLRIDKQTPPPCITTLLRKYDDKRFKTLLHQASNSLRVTLCEFPCVPTIHNTVSAAIIHVKYTFGMLPFYRRHMIFMNLTSPFEIIGMSSNLMYAGSDEKDMLFTVSIAWDKHFQKRRDWEDATDLPRGYMSFTPDRADTQRVAVNEYSGEVVANPNLAASVPEHAPNADTAPPLPPPPPPPPPAAAVPGEPVLPAPLAEPADVQAAAGGSVAALGQSNSGFQKRQLQAAADPGFHETESEPPAPPEPEHILKKSKNPLISEYHHGWIDDMVLINIGIRDADSAILHVPMRKIVECMEICSR